MFIAMIQWSGSRLLVSGTPSSLDPHWNSSGISRGRHESGLDVTVTWNSSIGHSDVDISWSSDTNLDSGD